MTEFKDQREVRREWGVGEERGGRRMEGHADQDRPDAGDDEGVVVFLQIGTSLDKSCHVRKGGGARAEGTGTKGMKGLN